MTLSLAGNRLDAGVSVAEINLGHHHEDEGRRAASPTFSTHKTVSSCILNAIFVTAARAAGSGPAGAPSTRKRTDGVCGLINDA
jgi:hypothetical protein